MIRTAHHTVPDDYDRLVVVSDIHCHLPPLHAIDDMIARMPGRSRVIFNGDAFFGGPRVVETARWVKQRAGQLALLGNHDEGMLGSRANPQDPPTTEPGAHARLSESELSYFANLPQRLELTWRGRRATLMHGHITPDSRPGSFQASPDEVVQNFLEPDADVNVVSHTHYAFIRKAGDTTVINTGSVSVPILGVRTVEGIHIQSGGKYIDEDPWATFGVITFSHGRLIAELIRFDYDRDAALDDLANSGDSNLDMIRQWLDDGVIRI